MFYERHDKFLSMEKDFAAWHDVKETLHMQGREILFKEREIWWFSMGANIGHESDGKNRFFTRPVLVLRKFNAHLFWGVPLTTQVKQNPYYLAFEFQGKPQCAQLSQLRAWDSKRLRNRMGEVSDEAFVEIRTRLSQLLALK